MEKPNDTYRNLGDYFSKAREITPVSGLDDMQRLIRNAKMQPPGKPIFKRPIFKYALIMTSSIILISAYFSGLFSTHTTINKHTISTVKNNTEIHSAISAPKQAAIRNTAAYRTSGQKPSLLMPLCFINYTDGITGSLADLSPINALQPLTISNTTPPASNPGPVLTFANLSNVQPIELTRDQLEKIGIHKEKRGMSLAYHVSGKGLVTFSTGKKGTNINVFNESPLSKDGKQMKSVTMLVHQKNPDPIQLQAPANGQTMVKVNNNNTSLHPLETDYYPALITITDVPDETSNVDSLFCRKNADGSIDSTPVISLIPILVKEKDFKGTEYKKDMVLWFTAEPSFIKLIKDISGKDVQGVNFARTWNKSEEEYSKTNAIDPAIMNQVTPLALDKATMEKLGFIFNKPGFEYHCIINDKGKLNYTNSKKGVTIMIQSPLRSKESGQDFYPVFMTDKNGVQTMRYRFDKNTQAGRKEFLSAIHTLVPVLVDQEAYGGQDKKTVIFWFNVTPDFLAALPEDIAKDMQKEYQVITGKAPVQDNSSTACKYFDACHMQLEQDLKVNIYPNPTVEKLNVDFTLPGNETATISFTDLEGRMVKTLANEYSGTGNQHAEIMTGNLKAGIYLVNIKLSGGVVISKRVVVTGKDK